MGGSGFLVGADRACDDCFSRQAMEKLILDEMKWQADPYRRWDQPKP